MRRLTRDMKQERVPFLVRACLVLGSICVAGLMQLLHCQSSIPLPSLVSWITFHICQALLALEQGCCYGLHCEDAAWTPLRVEDGTLGHGHCIDQSIVWN
mmetsp:Transcript_18543/g.43408  ORF Transcript_18543/g.43408 Transcript_18543/m.43408 type:complete len:100 (+) Transcript_18543:858-1157(+)